MIPITIDAKVYIVLESEGLRADETVTFTMTEGQDPEREARSLLKEIIAGLDRAIVTLEKTSVRES